jgi:lipopolysaccharide/colanic/teichoic acid biosynthesis glycosyltransferase
MQRSVDIVLSALGLLIMFPILLIILTFGFFDTGSPVFIQKRVGKNKRLFYLVKFRTMKKNTASIASHLASPSSITQFGAILRKTKIDELPQLFNVLKGDMSLVGPRPNLFNQTELIAERETLDIYAVRPGITGLAQIKNIDMSTPKLLAETDAKMLSDLSIKNYFFYIAKTVLGSGKGDAVKPQ